MEFYIVNRRIYRELPQCCCIIVVVITSSVGILELEDLAWILVQHLLCVSEKLNFLSCAFAHYSNGGNITHFIIMLELSENRNLSCLGHC